MLCERHVVYAQQRYQRISEILVDDNGLIRPQKSPDGRCTTRDLGGWAGKAERSTQGKGEILSLEYPFEIVNSLILGVP